MMTMMTENVKVLGEFEAIKIGFEGREECLLISGNGDIQHDLGTIGGTENLFNFADNSRAIQNTACCPTPSGESFYRQQSYLNSLVEVAARTDHKLHDEINEAVKKLKELVDHTD